MEPLIALIAAGLLVLVALRTGILKHTHISSTSRRLYVPWSASRCWTMLMPNPRATAMLIAMWSVDVEVSDKIDYFILLDLHIFLTYC